MYVILTAEDDSFNWEVWDTYSSKDLAEEAAYELSDKYLAIVKIDEIQKLETKRVTVLTQTVISEAEQV